MSFTLEQFKRMFPYAKMSNIDRYYEPLKANMALFGITEDEAVAAFLAQLAHESGSLNYVKELASGAAYDTGRLAVQLGNTPEADGDGQKYKGRGLIQITGKNNYKRVADALGVDCINHPELLEDPQYATASACWYWAQAGLNKYCNPCTDENFKIITKKINGGYNGLADRQAHWKRCKDVLNVK